MNWATQDMIRPSPVHPSFFQNSHTKYKRSHRHPSIIVLILGSGELSHLRPTHLFLSCFSYSYIQSLPSLS